MARTSNEIERLIEAWFQRELDRAWRQFDAGAAVGGVVAGIEDAGERRAQVRHLVSSMADHRLDALSAMVRAGDYRAGHDPARAIQAALDAPVDEGDRRFTVIAREMMRAQGQVRDAEIRWRMGGRIIPRVEARAARGAVPATGAVADTWDGASPGDVADDTG